MRKNVFKQVRNLFSKDLGSICPQFSKCDSPQKDCDLYLWKSKGRNFYIFLYGDRKYEWFYVEAAVTDKNEFPINKQLGLPTDNDRELRFRINRIWAPYDNRPPWPVGKDPLSLPFAIPSTRESDVVLLENVPRVVSECVNSIKTFVVPFFEEILSKVV